MTPKHVKCVIWDLDETLWDGSLAENDHISARPPVIELIPRLTAKGIINSICSKNSYEHAKQALQRLGIWDHFVFPVIDYVPKGQTVKAIVDNLQLRPDNVLFVDDNTGNRKEVEFYCRSVMSIDPNDAQFLPFMNRLIEAAQGTPRLDQYKLLERKHTERRRFADNLQFLADSDITACVLRNPADMIFRSRIHELAERANQLNFTKTRFGTVQQLDEYLANDSSIYIHHGVVFVYDKYGDYGLVGFYAINEKTTPTLEHFVFSCRIMNMGIEQAVYALLRREVGIRPFPPLENTARTVANVSIIKALDERLRTYIDSHSLAIASYKTMVVGGCTSGIIDHYLAEHMRPVQFEQSVLAQYGRVLTATRYLIYTVYSDYINPPWANTGVRFSYQRFSRHLSKFLSDHSDRRIYLLLASDNTIPQPRRKGIGRVAQLFWLAREATANGKHRVRYKKCNRLVKALAQNYDNVTLVPMGGFVERDDEQIDPRHFSRLVIKRVCDHISHCEVRHETAAG